MTPSDITDLEGSPKVAVYLTDVSDIEREVDNIITQNLSDDKSIELIEAFYSKFENEAARSAIPLFWPLWNKIDRLSISKRMLTWCYEDLDWVFSVNALAIAQRCAESLLMFPEVQLYLDREKWGKRLSVCGVGTARLHCAILAHIVAPEARSILEDLVFCLAEFSAWSSLSQLLIVRLEMGDNEAFVTRLARLLQSRPINSDIIAIAVVMGDYLGPKASLANQSVGQILQQTISKNDRAHLDPLGFNMAVIRARELVKTHKIDRKALPTDITTSVMATFFLRAADRVAPLRAAQSSDRVVTADKHPGGESSWNAYQLERGPLHISGASFRSAYAVRHENSFKSKQHNIGEPFQYGPYISMKSGYYKINFLGTSEIGCSYELQVSGQYGTNKIASLNTVGATWSDPGLLGSVTVRIDEPLDAVEFLIYSKSQYGEITSSGVYIYYTPL